MRLPYVQIPGGTSLFLDYVGAWERVRPFYGSGYSLKDIVGFARRLPPLDARMRRILCQALERQQKGWGGMEAPVTRLAEGAVAVVTGQQPGLFTGPLYAVLKALTAIKLARRLEQSGVPAVPVFWVAAEDHDYEEIRWAALLDRNSLLFKTRVDLGNRDSIPVGWLRFGEDVRQSVEQCFAALPESEFHAEVRGLLSEAYRPSVNPADAFARMMATLFRAQGLIVMNPLDPEIKQLGEATLSAALEMNDRIRQAVLERSRAVSAAGYHEQVKVDSSFTGLFSLEGQSRLPLRPGMSAPVSRLSANVLLRPAVQDTILPTAVYVGGPAEIAYFAQASAVFEVLGKEAPPVFPRISATIFESRVARAMRKYNFDLRDVFRGREHMKRKAVETVQSVEAFDRARGRILEQMESLRPVLGSVDATLGGALDTSIQKVRHQVENLQTKFVDAEARRNATLERQLEMALDSLYPERKLQERVINVTSFLVRYGLGFVEWLDGQVSLDTQEHQVVSL